MLRLALCICLIQSHWGDDNMSCFGFIRQFSVHGGCRQSLLDLAKKALRGLQQAMWRVLEHSKVGDIGKVVWAKICITLQSSIGLFSLQHLKSFFYAGNRERYGGHEFGEADLVDKTKLDIVCERCWITWCLFFSLLWVLLQLSAFEIWICFMAQVTSRWYHILYCRGGTHRRGWRWENICPSSHGGCENVSYPLFTLLSTLFQGCWSASLYWLLHDLLLAISFSLPSHRRTGECGLDAEIMGGGRWDSSKSL